VECFASELTVHSADVCAGTVEQQQSPILDQLRSRYAHALRVFDHYATLGAGDPFAMQSGAWGQLMQETGIAGEPMQRGTSHTPCP
jgi:hypothetical protein